MRKMLPRILSESMPLTTVIQVFFSIDLYISLDLKHAFSFLQQFMLFSELKHVKHIVVINVL